MYSRIRGAGLITQISSSSAGCACASGFGRIREREMSGRVAAFSVLFLLLGGALGKTKEEWKSRIIYQVSFGALASEVITVPRYNQIDYYERVAGL